MADDNNKNNHNNHGPFNPDEPQNHSRRNLLKQVGLVGAAALSSGGATIAVAASSTPAAPATPVTPLPIPVREAFEVLTAAESEVLEAVVDRILPSDENGPGALEARAAHFIDRSLAGYQSDSREGYALGLLAIDEHARVTKSKGFASLSPAEQDVILTAVAANEIKGFESTGSSFFNMVRNHTIDGTFSDPYYGGNRDFVGWDMLGYPGVRMGASDSEVRTEENLAPNHQSAYDMGPYNKQPRASAYKGG